METIEIPIWTLVAGIITLLLVILFSIIHRIVKQQKQQEASISGITVQLQELQGELSKLQEQHDKTHQSMIQLDLILKEAAGTIESNKQEIVDTREALSDSITQHEKQLQNTADLIESRWKELEEKIARCAPPRQHTETFGQAYARTKNEPAETTPQQTAQIKFTDLTVEQKSVINQVNAGVPIILVTGRAGTGKSALIDHIHQTTTKNHAVLAPTGVAAINIKGQTIHSFFNFPPKPLASGNARKLEEEKDRALYEKLELLIIDEISMVRVDLMDTINLFLQNNRAGKKGIPFGGVQILMVGDPFQLPPFAKSRRESNETQSEKEILQKLYPRRLYFFSAPSLEQIPYTHITLTHIFRQTDNKFTDLLNRIRIDLKTNQVLDKINNGCFILEVPPKKSISLTAYNRDANNINNARLAELPGTTTKFIAKIEDDYPEGEYPTQRILELKKGTRIMVLANLSEKCVNGSMGTVSTLSSEKVTIRLDNGTTVSLGQHTWERTGFIFDRKSDEIKEEVLGKFTQIPIRLGWAITIHKSQGQTIENIHIDLGRGAWDPGQVYVALSRCPALSGITLSKKIRERDIPNPKEMLQLMQPFANH